MELEQKFLELEENFWLGNVQFYQTRLTPDCLMVFAPPLGVMKRKEILRSIADGPRWKKVNFIRPRVKQLMDDVVVLTYSAIARREDDPSPYQALTSSLYLKQDGVWKLAFHQHTPGG